jgi:diguanylate cyclase (GGDEF)-like protein
MAVGSITSSVLARAQAYLFISAALLGILGVVLPHPAGFEVLGLVAIQVASVACAAFLFVSGDRLPAWALQSGPWLATGLTSVAILFSRDSTSAYTLFYLWVGFYAFYFLPRRGAASLGAFAIVNYAAVVILVRFQAHPPSAVVSDADIHHFALIAGTLVVAGTFIVLLRERIGRLIAQLTDAATTDPLTGLVNRRGFQRLIQIEIDRARRGQQPFALVMGDCDHFKLVNDRIGHAAGDATLQRIGALMETEKRSIDTAARIAGEEFALVLPQTDAHEAYIVAERMRNVMRDELVHEEGRQPLTMSFGVAAYPVHAAAPESLMRASEEALYAAKRLGRDRTVLHSQEIEGILSEEASSSNPRDQARLATVLGLAEALDLRDSGTARHSQTVGRYCRLMGRELALAPEHVERLRLAGVLHDIGKIGVPDSILRKPGVLTDDEYAQMRTHPEIGSRILGGSDLADIRDWIHAHHERPDGRGYPHGVADAQIPLEAKVLAVADAYEAMTSDRVYRRSIGVASARAELQRCAGTQFDARVVKAFLGVLDREGAAAAANGTPAA